MEEIIALYLPQTYKYFPNFIVYSYVNHTCSPYHIFHPFISFQRHQPILPTEASCSSRVRWSLSCAYSASRWRKLEVGGVVMSRYRVSNSLTLAVGSLSCGSHVWLIPDDERWKGTGWVCGLIMIYIIISHTFTTQIITHLLVTHCHHHSHPILTPPPLPHDYHLPLTIQSVLLLEH